MLLNFKLLFRDKCENWRYKVSGTIVHVPFVLKPKCSMAQPQVGLHG